MKKSGIMRDIRKNGLRESKEKYENKEIKIEEKQKN